ncbi:MAG: response regulator [Zetaproteobacteria bacterium]|nr:MAG: response regulator [Zetaproteobacteria bacterium]
MSGAIAGKRVLLVDDNANNLMLFGALLQANGALVESVDSGEACLESVARSVPDIILLDIQMPGIDGVETLHRLRRMEGVCEVPVVALTANAMDGDCERLLGEGFDGYMAKPINTRSFVSEVAGYLS